MIYFIMIIQVARKPLENWAKENGVDEPYERLLLNPKARKVVLCYIILCYTVLCYIILYYIIMLHNIVPNMVQCLLLNPKARKRWCYILYYIYHI